MSWLAAVPLFECCRQSGRTRAWNAPFFGLHAPSTSGNPAGDPPIEGCRHLGPDCQSRLRPTPLGDTLTEALVAISHSPRLAVTTIRKSLPFRKQPAGACCQSHSSLAQPRPGPAEVRKPSFRIIAGACRKGEETFFGTGKSRRAGFRRGKARHRNTYEPDAS